MSQHTPVDSDSDDFMTEDDYSIAYAGGGFGVRTAAQAATLTDKHDGMLGAEGFADDSGFTDDGDIDAFHDDAAEAAAATATAATAAADGGSDGSADAPWAPAVLAAPVPKHPRCELDQLTG
jgi:hypothetical protein